jgi:hypothetical protein
MGFKVSRPAHQFVLSAAAQLGRFSVFTRACRFIFQILAKDAELFHNI